MATATVEKHQDASRALLYNAQVELDRGDVLRGTPS